MIITKDYLLAALAGFLSGICLIPTLLNIGYSNQTILYVLPFLMAVAWAVGLWIGQELTAKIPIMLQLAKFAEIGVLNTAINFGVLNLASLMTGVTAGLLVGGYNVPGTLVAATNSYFWNKLWVFKKIDNKGLFNDVPKFALVTIVGMVVNSLVIIVFTSYLKPMFGLAGGQWLNIGKVLATLLGVLIDFLGYKFIVFRTKENSVGLSR
jgi:putative flippase GtrA